MVKLGQSLCILLALHYLDYGVLSVHVMNAGTEYGSWTFCFPIKLGPSLCSAFQPTVEAISFHPELRISSPASL